jgi:hypothetical protein
VKLPALKELWIAGNKLTALPEGLHRMPLDVLSLGGNPMRRPGWFSFAPRFRAKTVYWN